MTASAQEIRAVLAKWTANDWRHAFSLAPDLEPALRDCCDVPSHAPLTGNSGAVAMPVQRRLGQLGLPELQDALAPLVARLGGGPVGVPGLDALAELQLEPRVQLGAERRPPAVAAARRVLADVEAGRPARPEDLDLIREWGEGFEQESAALDDVLRTIAESPLSAGAEPVLAEVRRLAAEADPAAVAPEQRELFFAVHRLLCQPAWDASDQDVATVEGAFGPKVARVLVAERG